MVPVKFAHMVLGMGAGLPLQAKLPKRLDMASGLGKVSFQVVQGLVCALVR